MADKNLLIVDGSSCEPKVSVTPRKKVSFHPADSDHTVRVCFVERIPFSDWASKCKTGEKGKALTGKVRNDADGDYHYRVESLLVSTGPERQHPLANPQLIVDGGEPAPPRKKHAKPRKKTTRKK